MVKSQCGALFDPRLVMIWTTPLDASVPYSVAAAGPLMISMDSMSSGLMSLRRLAPAPPRCAGPCEVLASMRTPSMYTIGSVAERQASDRAYADLRTGAHLPRRRQYHDAGRARADQLLDAARCGQP